MSAGRVWPRLSRLGGVKYMLYTRYIMYLTYVMYSCIVVAW